MKNQSKDENKIYLSSIGFSTAIAGAIAGSTAQLILLIQFIWVLVYEFLVMFLIWAVEYLLEVELTNQ